jgi:hypothetical protein
LLNTPDSDSNIACISAADFAMDLFTVFAIFLRGETFVFNASGLNLIELLCEGLGNHELSEQVIEFATDGGNLTASNCISCLHLKRKLNLSIDSKIDFIASHFSHLHH